MDAFCAQDMGPQGPNDRIQRHHAGADPVGERRDVKLNPLASIGLALTIERLMQKELGDQHHRQKARAGKSARDRMRWRRRLGNRLAVPARELLPHVLDDLPSPRLAFQRLRHHLAELAQPNTAAFSTGAWRRFDDSLNR